MHQHLRARSAQPAPLLGCTMDTLGNFRFMNPNGTANNTNLQFCSYVTAKAAFPAGEDTILKGRATDTAGNPGPASETVVRIQP